MQPKMPKSSPFAGIPTVPTTVSGQWLAFSHMANHYRKLLNVKPRVSTNPPPKKQTSTISNTPRYSPSSKFAQFEQKKVDKQKSTNLSVPCHNKNGGVKNDLTNTAIKKAIPTKSRSYQIIFDQTELNNLSEAVMSDTEPEPDEPYNSGIDISEKIRLYLDHLEENSASKYKAALPTSQGILVTPTPAQGRHSRCFLPVESTSSPQSRPRPKIMVAKTNYSSPSKRSSVKKDNNSIVVNSLIYKAGFKLKPERDTNNVKKKISSKSARTVQGSRNNGVKTPNSSASFGTVHGSEELTGGMIMSLVGESGKAIPKGTRTTNGVISSHNSMDSALELETFLRHHGVSTDISSSKSKSNHHHRSRYGSANNSRAQPISSSLSGLINNKDSSRDSAYGFSSGESKMTTRESTPEKRRATKRNHLQNNAIGLNMLAKHKSNLSTVASSINQDSLTNLPPGCSTSTFDSVHATDGRKHLATKEEFNYPGRSTSWIRSEPYINFITTVTDDVIGRQVFTNKGLKALFQTHLEANKDLEMEKMTYMLDRLRMDVGVPKDDSLNHLGFGYGSINYASPVSFFSQLGGNRLNLGDFNDGDDIPEKATPVRRRSESKHSANLTNKNVLSDVTIHELHRRNPPEDPLGLADEESSKVSCSSENVRFQGYQQIRRSQEDDERYSSNCSEADISLTDSQIQNALTQVGFDDDSTLDLIRIVTRGRQGKKSRHIKRNQAGSDRSLDSVVSF